ncbi:MAG TPA: TetR family transcriptional regulator [Nevskiaceae bacterium]|nr:TetR family transcriptional regulator [Nevskiaceae bacterium]
MNAAAAIAPMPEGKRRLIDAALRLAARDGVALTSLGLRELAREADLNHNTFYRHFGSLDELGAAAADAVVTRLMSGMQAIRRSAVREGDATVRAADFFLDFAREHPEVIVVGLRELHSVDSPLRGAMKKVLQDIAEDSADQMQSLGLVAGLSREGLVDASSAISYYIWYRSLDAIERPRQRKAIRDDIVAFIRAQFLGRLALERSAA